MSGMKSQASRCVVIGDLVGSRGAPNRRALHRAVEKALVSVNATVPAVTELRVTVGDEFQGAYATLGAAIEAALRVRLELLPAADVRVGIGRGPVQLLDAERGIEDGPGLVGRPGGDRGGRAGGRACGDPSPAHRVPCGTRRRRRGCGWWRRRAWQRRGPTAPVTTPPTRSTPHCCVGTIWLARCRNGRSDY